MAASVTIITTDNRYQISAQQGPNPTKITDGFGGWQVISRPRKVGFTQFQGRNPFQMQLNLMFDGYAKNQSQETALRTLTWMAIPPQGSRDPRRVRLFGPALPYPSSGEWVINGLDEGDNIIWDSTGKYRLRSDITLTLLRYVNSDALKNVEVTIGLAVPNSQVIKAKAGDTARTLAAYYYGDSTLWHTIAAANGIRDPAYSIKAGTAIRIP